MPKSYRFIPLYSPPEIINKNDLCDIEKPDEHNPLGKGDTAQMGTVPFKHHALSLVYAECESFNSAVSKNVRIIIGRRGSGKSALLNILENHKTYSFTQRIKAHDIRQFVEKAAREKTNHDLSYDEYSEEIENFFDLQILFLVDENFDNCPKVRRFLIYKCESYEKNRGILPGWKRWLENLTENRNPLASSSAGIANPIFDKAIPTKSEALNEAKSLLKGKKIALLIDNPEDYKLTAQNSLEIFRSLIYVSAIYQVASIDVTVKFFVPDELFTLFFIEKSVNYGKVEGKIHRIIWKPEELFSAIAKRIRFYKFANGLIDGDETNMGELDDPAIFKKEWESVFEKEIWNEDFKVKEHSFQYLIRHTQLIPRQMVKSGNNIIKRYTKEMCCDKPLSECYTKPIDSKMIIKGIKDSEFTNAKDSLNAFSQRFENIELFCHEFFHELKYSMDLSQLKQIFEDIKDDFIKYINRDSFVDFKKMLCELGVIGILKKKYSNEFYTAALFQHDILTSQPLRINNNDQIFIHPMFIHYLATETQDVKRMATLPTMPLRSFIDFLHKKSLIKKIVQQITSAD